MRAERAVLRWVPLLAVVVLLAPAAAGALGTVTGPPFPPSAGPPSGPLPSPSQAPPAPWNLSWQPGARSANATGPSSLSGAALAWDPRDGYLVEFGGNGPGGQVTNATWTFSDGTWTNRTVADASPPPLAGASMDFDYSLDEVVLFGGCGPSVCPSAATWAYAGGSWLNVTNRSLAQPPARYDASLAYANDTPDRTSVLFGGCLTADCSIRANDTWLLNTTLGWLPGSPVRSPPPLSGAALAFDPSVAGLVLFGGCTGGACLGTNASWSFASGNWSRLAAGPSLPPPAVGALVSFSRSLSSLVAVVSTGGSSSTWGLACSPACNWLNQTSAVGGDSLPPGGAMASEVGSLVPIAVAGGSTWVLEPTLGVNATILPNPAPAGTVLQGRANATGGTGPYGYLWTGGAAPAATQNVTVRFASVGVYFLNVTAWDRFGVKAQLILAAQATGPVDSFRASPGRTDVGYPINFTAGSPTGGTAPYTLAWTFGDGTTGAGPNASHRYGALGEYFVELNVTDAHGLTDLLQLTVSVVADPVVAISVPYGAVDAGVPSNLTAIVNGGVAPVVYDWWVAGAPYPGAGPVLGPTLSVGVVPVELEIIDGVGARSVAFQNVTVHAFPAVGVSIFSNETYPPTQVCPAGGAIPAEVPVYDGDQVPIGAAIDLQADPSLGTPPYQLLWVFQGPSGTSGLANASNYTFVASAGGQFNATAILTDAVGVRVVTTVFVVATDTPIVTEPAVPCECCGPPSGPGVVLGVLAVAVLGALIAGVVALSVYWTQRRRSR